VWAGNPPKILIIEIQWGPERSRWKIGRNSTIDERISVLGKDFRYVGSIMHAEDPQHFFPIVLFDDQLWGPPLKDRFWIDCEAEYYCPFSARPYVPDLGNACSLLHCYIPVQTMELE
jgi:hypothetical protein